MRSVSRLILSQLVSCSPHCSHADTGYALLLSRGLARKREATRASTDFDKQLAALKQGQFFIETEEASASASASASEPQVPVEAAAEKKSWLPKWLNVFSPAKDLKDGAAGKGMDWKDLDKIAKNFEIEVYRQLCYNARTSSPPPVPRRFKKPLNSRIHGQYLIDLHRVAYLRTAQHEKIASNLTAAQRAAVKEDANAVIGNQQLLQEMAATVGYGVPEVRDCLRTYNQMRQRIMYLYRWKKLGRSMPSERGEIDRVVQQMQEADEKELERRLYGKRNKANCPLQGKIKMLGTRVTCPLTQMPYTACCGAGA